jgi:hypothetical protein
MIRFGCPTCNKVIKAPDEGAGRKIPCPRCGQLLVIPAPLHQKNKAIRGLLLPEPEAVEPVAVATTQTLIATEESSVGSSATATVNPATEGEPQTEIIVSNDPPPVRVGILVEEPSPRPQPSKAQPPPPANPLTPPEPDDPTQEGKATQRHSVVGIASTIGAGVVFVMLFVFMQICQGRADEISRTPGANLPAVQSRFDTLNTVAKVICISSILSSLLWLALSLRSPTKRLWTYIGAVANGLLLIWILVNPMAIKVVAPVIAKRGDESQNNPRSSPKKESTPEIPKPMPKKADVPGERKRSIPKEENKPEVEKEPQAPVVIQKPRYLSDMEEFDIKVTQGPPGVDRFAKNGNLGYGENDPRYANGRIRVKGEESPHGLSLCPDSNTFAGVKYRLNKTGVTFITSAALNDTVGAPGMPPGVGKIPTPLTFEVWGDGKLLWRSKPVNEAGIVQECNVSVAGVEVLDLRMQCPGDCTNASGVWVEPRIVNPASGPIEKEAQANGLKNRREDLQKNGLKGIERRQPGKIFVSDAQEFVQQILDDKKELAMLMQAEGITGNELKENAFTKKWKKNWEGQPVRITGVISQIKAGSISRVNKAGKLVQSAVVRLQDGNAQFFFDLDHEPDLEKVKTLDIGKSVTIQGTVTGYWRTAIYVTHCSLVKGEQKAANL